MDCFGIMHEPDQRCAFELRAKATAGDGVLLLQYHSIGAIVKHGQWNALRHGHFAYYSLTTLIAVARCGGNARGRRLGVRSVRRNGVSGGSSR